MVKSTERAWLEVGARLFTSNGTSFGIVSLETTAGFHVKQKVIVEATGIESLRDLEVKRVINKNLMVVGPVGSIGLKADLTQFTVDKQASIKAPEQPRPSLDEKTHERAVYEEEPIMAKRSFLVDEFGEGYTLENPFPASITAYQGVCDRVEIGTVNKKLISGLRRRTNLLVKNPNAGPDVIYVAFSAEQLNLDKGFPLGSGDFLTLDLSEYSELWVKATRPNVFINIIELGVK